MRETFAEVQHAEEKQAAALAELRAEVYIYLVATY
jgi:hypothetical protein